MTFFTIYVLIFFMIYVRNCFCFIGLQELASISFYIDNVYSATGYYAFCQIASATSAEPELHKLIQAVSYRKAALTDSIRIRFEFEP